MSVQIAYLVFAYKNPRLLARCLDKLTSPESAFIVHIDEKVDITEFVGLRRSNLSFIENRVRVFWGEFSGVEAQLLLLQKALDTYRSCNRFVLLSGSEYPLRSRKYIEAFFEGHSDQEFISMVRVPNRAAGKPQSRIDTLVMPSNRPVIRFVVKVAAKMGLAKRNHKKYLGDLEPYSGSTWWALTRAASDYILDFARDNLHVADYFRGVFAPEEAFFHTILGNSKFAPQVRRNLLYEDWTAGGSRPAAIAANHLELFESLDRVEVADAFGSGEALFARKLSDESFALVERLDARANRLDDPLPNLRQTGT